MRAMLMEVRMVSWRRLAWGCKRGVICLVLAQAGLSWAQEAPQRLVHGLWWDAHEVTIGQVKALAKASGFVSQAEKGAGGQVYEAGWTTKPGWTWRTPYGVPAQDDEPAVHLNFDEAQSLCRQQGKRLPTDAEWVKAAYLEQRDPSPAGWIKGKRYTYPQGDRPLGSHCLEGCGSSKGVAPPSSLWRGTGHVPVMRTPAGVNGLWDMGGNVWEWVDTASGHERITRGGSWWYGPERQLEADVATKPRQTQVVYIGFRCVKAP